MLYPILVWHVYWLIQLTCSTITIMFKNIMWKGITSESLEYCSIYYKDIIMVKSSIIGHYQYLPFKNGL